MTPISHVFHLSLTHTLSLQIPLVVFSAAGVPLKWDGWGDDYKRVVQVAALLLNYALKTKSALPRLLENSKVRNFSNIITCVRPHLEHSRTSDSLYVSSTVEPISLSNEGARNFGRSGNLLHSSRVSEKLIEAR